MPATPRAERPPRRWARRLGLAVTAATLAISSLPAFADPALHITTPGAVVGNASVVLTFSQDVGTSGLFQSSATCTSATVGATTPVSVTKHSAPFSPIVVSGLTNGASYTCSVHVIDLDADTADGTSASFTPVGPPSKVTPAPTAARGSSGQVTVTFTELSGAGTGGAAVTYTAACDSADVGAASSSASGLTSPITVTGLTNGDSYTCTVTGANSAGTGPTSDASSAVTPATTPGAPTAVTLTRAGTGSLSVAFTAPASTGGSAITSYEASCSTSTPGGSAGSGTDTTTPVTVSGLTNGASYTCTVTASNAVGAGSASSPSDALTAATSPNRVSQPTISRGGSQTLSVAFTELSGAGQTGGLSVTYSASCTSADVGAASGSATGSSSPLSVASLTNGDTYGCTITSTNAVGSATASLASSTLVVAGSPAQVAQPTITRAGSGALSVSFTDLSGVAQTGGLAVTYSAACTSSGAGTPGSASGSGSPITVSSLTNGESYTCTITAANDAGTATASTASTALIPGTTPGAPTITGATPGDGSVDLAFTAPGSTGGLSITSYSASCTPVGGGGAITGSGSSSPVTVSGLTNGTSYTCTLAAVNAAGTGSASAASSSFTPTGGATAPDAPTLTDAARGDSQILLAWSAPVNDGGSGLTGYNATCTPVAGGPAVNQSQSGTATTMVFTGLTNGTSYRCKVQALNAIGAGSYSAESSAVVPARAPDAVEVPVVTRAGSGALSVAFTDLVGAATGGLDVTYTATCTDGGGSHSNTGTESPVVVSGLTNGNDYACIVDATNGVGTTVGSAAPAVLVAATPGAPSLTSVTRGNGTAAVAFSAPGSDGGSSITGYSVSCSSSDGGAARSATGASSPITVSSLTPGATYSCTVAATNVAGTGTASAASSPFVAGVTPSAPSAPTITRAGSGSVSVAFSALAGAATGGLAIGAYDADCTSSDGGDPGSASGASTPLAVTGLTNGKSYTCTVTATNAVGSATSSASAALTAGTVASAPHLSDGARGNHKVTVSFTAPDDDGGLAVTGYTATCTSSDGGDPGSASGASSPLQVTGLNNGKTYTCSVVATNAAGDSAASSLSSAVVPARAPDQPAAPELSRASASSLTVTFLELSGSSQTGGLAVTYIATCTSPDGGTTRTATGAHSPLTVGSLDVGKTYSCTITAVNAVDSTASEDSDSIIVGTTAQAPTGVSATADDETLTVAFSAPVSDGGIPIYEYTATCVSSDGGETGAASGATSPIAVDELSNTSTYSCSVVATNDAGDSAPSDASDSVVVGYSGPTSPSISMPTPKPGAARQLDNPDRLLDTRLPGGTAMRGGEVRALQVAGRAGVPESGVGAVVLNVTAVNPSADGYLTLYPADTTVPSVSSVNFKAHATVPNAVVVKLSTDGRVNIFNYAGSTDVVVDVAGWYAEGSPRPGGLAAITPDRFLDTRMDPNPANRTVGAGQVKRVQIAGVGDVPATGVDSVVLNVTAVNPSADGYLTVYPAGAERPTASNVNFVRHQTVANAVVVKLSDSGAIDIYNFAGETGVLVDVAGWYRLGAPVRGGLVGVTPYRAYDSRLVPAGALGQEETRSVSVLGAGGVPDHGVGAVVLNVTAVLPTRGGYLTVFPTGETLPNTSNVNFVAGQIVPNLVIAKVGAGGSVDIYNYTGSTNVIVDVVGWIKG